jgi:PadR family transcriptional regulator, regulatory protein PadR
VADNLSLLKGTLDVLVLKTLSWGPMHGVEITTWLENRSDGSLGVDDSALYHALNRMEERGLVSSEWGLTENNRRARYYRATAAGRAWLKSESAKLMAYAKTLGVVLRTTSRYA